MIDTDKKLELHLKILKKRLLKEGVNRFHLYPIFCSLYEKNKENYNLPKFDILNKACEVLIEED